LLKTLPFPARLPILSLILGVLILVSVVPMGFYAWQVMDNTRDRLKTNGRFLQNTITRSLGEDIENRQRNMESMLANLSSAIQVSSGGDLSGQHINAPELRALLERFASSSGNVAYATILNTEAKGISAGRVSLSDDFFRNEMQRAFAAAAEGRAYSGSALTIESGRERHIVMLFSTPVMAGGRFIGMLGAAVDLEYLASRLRESSTYGLVAYVVDHQGRLVASSNPNFVTGQDMTRFEIVKNFVESEKAPVAATLSFTSTDSNGRAEQMLGTFNLVPSLGWAVVAQKPQSEAYFDIKKMQETAILYAIYAIICSIVISVLAAQRITTPINILTNSSRAIAQGDFSQRVHLKSRTEIGELADTFNHMTEDLERFVLDLKRAAEENRALFMGSIQMLAGAVDEKDPYTRGHSDRVTRFSTDLAKELGMTEAEIEVVKIAAQLHDVGKIGIEDRILKKPGALTPDEYEIMKTHTTRGANILRPVQQLKEMIPGIELHHESLDGRGYPFGLKGDEIPLAPRIIGVADTFDAMTTNRPYQAARPPEYALKIIQSLAKTKFDPKVVDAMQRLLERGDLHVRRAAVVADTPLPPEDANKVVVETTRS
jgi:putative nucleotidyltransferase with HDIG domain